VWGKWILMPVLSGCILIACSKKDAPENSQPGGGGGEKPTGETTGLVTATGVPAGTPESKQIGVEGGTFIASNGALKIDIPAGAFTTTQTVSVQPITNENKVGTGLAYRITPHNVAFKKPVTLTFNYTDSNLLRTIPQGLAIAYQDEKGVWQRLSHQQRDTVAKSISVQTTHFSDWGLFEMLHISPSRGFVDPGGSLALKVYKVLPYETIDDELDVPGVPMPVGDTTGALITEWTAVGGGTVQGTGSSVIYAAPNTMPEKNPVAVTARVATKTNAKLLLVSNIFVGKEGINFRINNGPWINAKSILGAIKVNDTLYTMQGVPIINNVPGGSFTISWLRGDAHKTEAWGLKFPSLQYADGNAITYWQFFAKPNSVEVSPGYFSTVDFYGDYVTGSFLLTRAGKETMVYPSAQWETARIEGHFRVKWKK